MGSCWPKLESADKKRWAQRLLREPYFPGHEMNQASVGIEALDFLIQLPGAWKKAHSCAALAPAPLS